MKIVQVIDRLNTGGAERVFVDLSNILYEHRQSVSIMFLLYPGPLANQLNPAIPQFVLNRKSKLNLLTYYRCAQYLRRFDIIHCHHRYVYSYIKLVSLLFPIKGKIILHDHYGPIDIDQSVPMGLKWLMKPNYFIGVSTSLTNWATEKLNISSPFFLPNIIRKRYAGPTSIKYDLVLVSNIKPIKNQLFAIQLAKKMNRQLLLIGNIQDDAYYSEVKQQSKDVMVQIITDCSDPHEYIAQSTFALHASKSETGPLVLIEYMAYGVPFLSYKTGEVAKQCGALVPEMIVENFDIDQWAERINQIELANRESLQLKLYNLYNNSFNENTYFETCLKIYNHINQNY